MKKNIILVITLLFAFSGCSVTSLAPNTNLTTLSVDIKLNDKKLIRINNAYVQKEDTKVSAENSIGGMQNTKERIKSDNKYCNNILYLKQNISNDRRYLTTNVLERLMSNKELECKNTIIESINFIECQNLYNTKYYFLSYSTPRHSGYGSDEWLNMYQDNKCFSELKNFVSSNDPYLVIPCKSSESYAKTKLLNSTLLNRNNAISSKYFSPTITEGKYKNIMIFNGFDKNLTSSLPTLSYTRIIKDNGGYEYIIEDKDANKLSSTKTDKCGDIKKVSVEGMDITITPAISKLLSNFNRMTYACRLWKKNDIETLNNDEVKKAILEFMQETLKAKGILNKLTHEQIEKFHKILTNISVKGKMTFLGTEYYKNKIIGLFEGKMTILMNLPDKKLKIKIKSLTKVDEFASVIYSNMKVDGSIGNNNINGNIVIESERL